MVELKFKIIMTAVGYYALGAVCRDIADGDPLLPFAASRSRLLYPVPASQISFTEAGNLRIRSPFTGISFCDDNIGSLNAL